MTHAELIFDTPEHIQTLRDMLQEARNCRSDSAPALSNSPELQSYLAQAQARFVPDLPTRAQVASIWALQRRCPFHEACNDAQFARGFGGDVGDALLDGAPTLPIGDRPVRVASSSSVEEPPVHAASSSSFGEPPHTRRRLTHHSGSMICSSAGLVEQDEVQAMQAELDEVD